MMNRVFNIVVAVILFNSYSFTQTIDVSGIINNVSDKRVNCFLEVENYWSRINKFNFYIQDTIQDRIEPWVQIGASNDTIVVGKVGGYFEFDEYDPTIDSVVNFIYDLHKEEMLIFISGKYIGNKIYLFDRDCYLRQEILMFSVKEPIIQIIFELVYDREKGKYKYRAMNLQEGELLNYKKQDFLISDYRVFREFLAQIKKGERGKYNYSIDIHKDEVVCKMMINR